MSPDKVHTVAMMAAILQAGDRANANRDHYANTSDGYYVALAAQLLDEASRQVRASGPTSTELPEARWSPDD